MILKYIVTDSKYQNINNILKQEFHISARLQHKLIVEKHIFLNDVFVDTRSTVSENDVITVNLDFEEESENIVPTKMELDIVYEDEAFLILNKPAGIAVHPSVLHFEDTLSNGVKYYFESMGLKRKIRPVNRLDLNTSGLIIFAKNEYIQECLIQQMASNTFKKEYIAIAIGHFKKPKGTINLPIARKENSIIERCVSVHGGQTAITDYEVIQEIEINSECFSVVKCYLQTGRTHQIRVHMSAIGHPLFGDTLYGSSYNTNQSVSKKNLSSTKIIGRQALHSSKVSFIHPITNKILEFTSDLPFDMLFNEKVK